MAVTERHVTPETPNNNPATIPWWLWPNVLSLDAPFIAVLWQALFARVAGAHLALAESVVLFLAVWAVYALDRLLDSLRLAPGITCPARHRFAAAHRRGFIAALVLVAAASAVLALRSLSLEIVAAGTVLGATVAIYFLWNQLNLPGSGKARLKEAVVGAVFAIGCAFIPMSRGNPSAILLPVFAFGCLCTANCFLIARLEREMDLARGEISGALRLQPLAKPARLLALIVVIFSTAMFLGDATGARLWAALDLSAAGLWLGAVVERRCGRAAACVWADASLLTPALFLF